MKLTVIKYGQSQIWESAVFEGGDPNAMLPISFLVYLIETENRKILVDTGCVTMADCWKMEHFCGVAPILAEMGLEPCDITDVIVTHAHHDHIECVGDYANARVYIQRDELEEARTYIPREMIVNTFADACEICEHVTVKKIGGHSVGSSVVEVRTTDTTYVIAGDECYTMACLTEQITPGVTCNRANSIGFLQTYRDEQYTVLLCHDANVLPDQSGYRVIV